MVPKRFMVAALSVAIAINIFLPNDIRRLKMSKKDVTVNKDDLVDAALVADDVAVETALDGVAEVDAGLDALDAAGDVAAVAVLKRWLLPPT